MTKIILGRAFPVLLFIFNWRLNWHLVRGWKLVDTEENLAFKPKRGFEITDLGFLRGTLLSARLEKDVKP